MKMLMISYWLPAVVVLLVVGSGGDARNVFRVFGSGSRSGDSPQGPAVVSGGRSSSVSLMQRGQGASRLWNDGNGTMTMQTDGASMINVNGREIFVADNYVVIVRLS